ncbi:Hypothetical predicted protein [Marmota monax]|uniref:Uncharacterized protein n=1 Tax=Marmota monax TaxID=9995 RepID=A0A5E4CI37_MARMO|nr:Hypothetical predicted protein [Marmota monax]
MGLERDAQWDESASHRHHKIHSQEVLGGPRSHREGVGGNRKPPVGLAVSGSSSLSPPLWATLTSRIGPRAPRGQGRATGLSEAVAVRRLNTDRSQAEL